MARIKIKLPQKIIYQTDFTVAVSDLNYGAHVGNERYLLFCQELRLQYLKKNQGSETSWFGPGLILTDCACHYQLELFHGDQFQGKLFLGSLNPFGMDFYYQFEKDSKTVFVAKTGMVFFDYEKRKVTKVPEQVLQIFGDNRENESGEVLVRS